jgi:hypothetical protein
MANLFNDDFIDFLRAFNNQKVEHLLVGGYAVILYGYTRSTADMDVWVKRTSENYQSIKKAFQEFGAPVFSEEDFLSEVKDVWALGREPSKIEIMSQVKGLDFDESLALCNRVKLEDFEVPYIHLKHLIKAKEASGRFKDLADIEQLKKNIKNQ